MMALAKNKLMDDNLDSSSSENEEKVEINNVKFSTNMMPLVETRRKLVDDDLDSSSDSGSESENESEVVPGPSSSVKVTESRKCNISVDKVKDDQHANDNDGINCSSNSIGFSTTQGELSPLSLTDSDEEFGGSLCSLDENNLDETDDKKYRPKQSKQSKTKKKTKKSKIQKASTSSNQNDDKTSSQHEEIEIKSNVPLSSSSSGRKNSQPKRSCNQKPRQYRRDRNDRNVSTQKPPKIPNIPLQNGHVEVKRVTANDALDILERMKSRLAIDSDTESNSKDKGSGKKRIGGGRAVKDICSVLVIRKKPEYDSDSPT